MLKKLIRQMLTAQILSALTVTLCLLIDSIVIGRFLGVKAIAAYGLANPILLIIGAFGSALSAGVQVVCSKSLGRGLQEETNAGYSSAIGLGAAFSIPFTLIIFFLSVPASKILGADTEQLVVDTSAYIRGFILGAPATMGALILVPFMQMAGKTTLLIVSVAAMTITDIVMDLLNVIVFHGGMFGMGLASSLSYYAALLIAGAYFLSKKCFFKFRPGLISKAKIKELVTNSIPAIFSMAASVVMVFGMNRILLARGGSDAVAAFSVISSIGNASNCITTGIGGVSLTLTGIFYNEEDKSGLRTMLKELAFQGVILGCAVGLLLVVIAPPAVGLFITEAGRSRGMAIMGLRLYALGLMPSCLTGLIKNGYQSAGKERYTEVISTVQNAVFPLLFALLLSINVRSRYMTGVWFYFGSAEIATLLLICLFVRKKSGKPAWEDLNVLMLPENFSVKAEEMMEVEIRSVEQVTEASEAAYHFCMSQSGDRSLSYKLSLCVEEMASNVVLHGFTKDNHEHHLSVRLMHKNGRWILRFRDDCRAFDPIHYVPKGDDKMKGMGIRLVMQLADEVRYTYSINLNNLMIMLKDKQ